MSVVAQASIDRAIEAEAQDHRRVYYGWVVVGAVVLVLAGFVGTLLSFGVFLKPLQAEFGWSRAATSGAMSLCIAVQGVTGIVMGRLVDRFNAGVVVAVGTLAGVAAYLYLSRLDSLWQFYLGFGVGAGICSGSAFTPWAATVSKWFDSERRTRALGISMTGIMVGQMALSPVMNQVISTGSWRVGYLVSAVVVLVCGVPGMMIVSKTPPPMHHLAPARTEATRRGPAATTQAYTVRQAVKTAPFWMLISSAFALSCGFYVVMSQIVAHARDVGLGASPAALIITVIGVGSLGGSLTAWWVARNIGHKWTLLVALLGQGTVMFMFTLTKSLWAFLLVAAFFGIVYGAAGPVRMAMIPHLFGLKSIGTMLGFSTFAWAAGGLVGPYFAGAVHDATGEYTYAFLVAGVLFLLAAVSVSLWSRHKA